MQNFDELAEGYLGLVEKQKVSEGKAEKRQKLSAPKAKGL